MKLIIAVVLDWLDIGFHPPTVHATPPSMFTVSNSGSNRSSTRELSVIAYKHPMAIDFGCAIYLICQSSKICKSMKPLLLT
jgi:hypothetical protein